MTSPNYPLFSEYQVLRRTNPNSYWNSRTQVEMNKAYLQHGMSFFDLGRAKR